MNRKEPTLEDRTPEEAEYDRSFGMNRRHRPSEYKLVHSIEETGGWPNYLVALNNSAQEFLASINIPPSGGAQFVEHVMAKAHAYNQSNEAEQELWKHEQKSALLFSCGGDQNKFDEIIALAAQTLKRAINHGSLAAQEFAEALSRSGAGNDVWIIKTLASQAAHYNRWRAGRPRKKTS